MLLVGLAGQLLTDGEHDDLPNTIFITGHSLTLGALQAVTADDCFWQPSSGRRFDVSQVNSRRTIGSDWEKRVQWRITEYEYLLGRLHITAVHWVGI